MCGFIGWISADSKIDRKQLIGASQRIRHRGPDDEGVLLLKENNSLSRATMDSMDNLAMDKLSDEDFSGAFAGFVFRRLAIRDLSINGHQPMKAECSDVWVLFNGEIYNDNNLRVELESVGYKFSSASDTEVLLAAYIEWGECCFQRLNGMFSIVIVDRRSEDKILLCRDRFGIKPFYYYNCGEELVFGSEIKALAAIDSVDLSVDEQMITNFLIWTRFPSTPDSETFYRHIKQVAPGEIVTWTNSKLHTKKYWQPPTKHEDVQHTDAEVCDLLRQTLKESVKRMLKTDMPVGSCLSGGLDSSAIVGLVNEIRKEEMHDSRQHTVSAVYHIEGPFNEKKFVDSVVKGRDYNSHYCYPSEAELCEDFDQLVWHQEEPFASPSIFAQWIVMKEATKQGITVLLDGQGADEAFGGYIPFRKHLVEVISERGLLKAIKETREIATYQGIAAWKALLFAVSVSLLPAKFTQLVAKLAYKRAYYKRAKNFIIPHLVNEVWKTVGDVKHHRSYYWRRVTEGLKEHSLKMFYSVNMPDLLRYEDKNSMAFSIEARVPFVDNHVADLAFTEAVAKTRVKNGWSKWVLREAASSVMPDEITWRRDKMGFGTPDIVLISALVNSRKYLPEDLDPVYDYVNRNWLDDKVREIEQRRSTGHCAVMVFRTIVLNQWLKDVESRFSK